ncbi:outer membrane beta-barrel protein [Lutibacter citreus]|uniref:outer membrane beta-barrel protein n=1 Tax=Lutibacter citreus TaxID=2138210 RepID=UPI000DBEA5C0|nr:outer membrane beta-barrel protein [Lutibacter citreus]
MRDYKNIDRIFQENLKDLEALPPNKSWNAIEKNLTPVVRRRRFPFWMKFASIAALLILFFSIGTIYFIPENNFSKNFFNEKNNLENNSKPKDSSENELVKNSKDKRIQLKSVSNDFENTTGNADLSNLEIENKGKNNIEETSSDKKTKSNSILVDAIQITNFNKKDKKRVTKNAGNSRITVATIFAPIYINSLGDGSGIDDQFKNSRASGSSSYSYGVKFAYKINNKFSVQSGVNLINLGYKTDNIYVTPGVSVLGFSNLSANPIVSKSQSLTASKQSTLNAMDPNKGSINQVFGYVEIPVELKYNVTDGKLGINLVGGFSTLLLNKDEVFVETNSFTQSLGSSNNLRSLNFSGNIGLDVDYSIQKNLFINVSPMIKVQTNTFSKNSGSLQPYYFGVYTGLNYKF